MPAFSLRTTHLVRLPLEHQPLSRDVANWLVRAVQLEGAKVDRVSENTLAFRPHLATWGIGSGYEPTLQLVSRGWIQVDPTPDGPLITVRIQPRSWLLLIPIVPFFFVIGWPTASNLLRLGVGVVGILVGAGLLVDMWLDASAIFARVAAEIRSSYANRPPSHKAC